MEIVWHGQFSNFTKSPFTLDGKEWRDVETYFQSRKTLDPKRQEEIRQAPSAMGAKMRGDSRKKTVLRSDWEQVKESFTLAGLRAKFQQNPALKKLLLSTQGKLIVEPYHKGDDSSSYWSAGKDGKGLNRLGWLLVQVRQELLNPELADR
jgi:N-glycosidase YbiA